MDELRPQNNVANFLKTAASPLQKFAKAESSSGVTLIVATLIAMLWANSDWKEVYFHLQHLEIGFNIGSFVLSKSLHHWVNDGLMVIFFFVVGMEIKRELLQGELSSPKKAALPIFAAFGGMIIPALLYTFFNIGTRAVHGWGIPMATDIAFAVGVLVLLGKRVPISLMVFLLALAIVDDLGAVLVIASFYTEHVYPTALGWAALGLVLIYMLQVAGVRPRIVYFVISIGIWFAVMQSGVHATIAGVVLGFLTPLKPLVDQATLKRMGTAMLSDATEEHLDKLNFLVYESRGPIQHLTELLHPWVNFAIMPIFALINAGIPLQGVEILPVLEHHVTLGVMLGLFLGKPLGVLLFSYLACKFKMAVLPTGVNWAQIFGVGAIAGIGFTMALFVSHLSFKNPDFEVYSKVGILAGSLLSAVVGSVILYFLGSKAKQKVP